MFGRKKPEPRKRRDRDLSQLGVFNLSEDYTAGKMEDDNKLEAVTTGVNDGDQKPKQPEKKLIPLAELDKMVAESLKDIGSDRELSGDDDDDSDLLCELQDLTGETVVKHEEQISPVSVQNGEADDGIGEKEQVFLPTSTTNIGILKNRIQMYELAENNAKIAGESGRARRFNRGLKTLKDMLKQVNAGKSINLGDIPPEVSVRKDTKVI